MLHRRVAWIALLLTLLLTLLIWKSTKDALLLAQQQQFENRASEVTTAVIRRLRSYEHLLRGGVGLFAASQSVSRTEWRDYVASLIIQEQYAGIQGIGFAAYIPAAHLNEHFRVIRAEGFPNYAIFPSGTRTEYTSIIYLEPFNWRNQRAFGFDMFSEAARRKAMERARDTGGTAISAKVTLIQEVGTQVQPGMLMYLPAYKNGAPRSTLEERRANLVGYVYSPFRLNDLMSGILGKTDSGAEPDVDIEIYDGKVRSVSSLLYDDDSIPHALGAPPPGSLTLTRPIDLYGHTWTLHFTTRPAFHNAFEQNKPTLILLFGTLLSVMLSWLIWVFATQRQRALALANQMAAEIAERREAQAENIRFTNALDNTQDMIFMFEPDTLRFVYLNQGALLSMGYSHEELLGMTPCHIKPLLPEPEFRQLIAPLLSGERLALNFETLHRRKDGTDFPVDILLQLIRESDGHSLFVAIMRDVTERKRTEGMLLQLATTDTLTGIFNRRHFNTALETEIKRAHRYRIPLALILFDIDQFKRINDTFGHPVGDLVLKRLADLVSEKIREHDIFARWGGEEFVILTPNNGSDGARKLAETLRKEIETCHCPEAGTVTCSFGVTELRADDQAENLLKRTDEALYQAKKMGRNRVEVS